MFLNSILRNAVSFIYGKCWMPSTEEDTGSFRPRCVSALAHDLSHFAITSKVPEELTRHVTSSKKIQKNWYSKLSKAWRNVKPPPKTAEEAARLVIQTLERRQKADLEVSTRWDGINVYVRTDEPRESSYVPKEVQVAARLINLTNNEEVLARIGIDAPEISMPYGKEARDELIKIIKSKRLRVQVYGKDRYGRSVGEVYCEGVLVQELMFKKCCAWHYSAYDHRVGLAKLMGEGGSSEVSWVMGSIKPRKAMGMKKGQT